MATNFPASLDTLTNPTSSDSLSSPSHSAQHANVNDAVEALQAKVGVDSSAVASSLDYKVAQLEAISHGKILQVVQTFVQGGFSTTSTSFVDVTGHTATITPSSATSKVYVIYTSALGHSTVSRTRVMNLVRDGINIAQPTSGGTPGTMNPWNNNLSLMHVSCNYLDSPATTSPVVYKMQVKTDLDTLYVGYYSTIKVPSSLTLMEVSA
jgi:hypothetical protein